MAQLQYFKINLEIFGIYFNPITQHRAVPPNHSLNRTHCGMRPKARHFILGL